jgi:3-oxoacyl-[acyl-carrier protein] reductase
MMANLLKGKNIVITGCLRGIGRTTLEVFAENKANIFACVQYQDTEFEESIQKLAVENDIWIKPIYFDLSDTDAIKEGMKLIISTKVQIDGLVNIAGMVYNGLFHMTSIDKMKEVFDIDFFSQMYITQYISKVMIKYKSGSIVNIASITGIDGNPGQIAYGAAKAALIGATKTLSIEFGQYGIRVNAVAPGVILTQMTKDLSEDKFNVLVEKTKIPRAGEPEEVANVLLYLISDMSTYITGQVLRIDGGIG